jgi:cytochrome P450
VTKTIGRAERPEFPGVRAAKCPFDPPPSIQALQEQAPLTRVRLPDGTTPWLATRYAEQRALLADPRVSADVTKPGYPSQIPVGQAAGGVPISFILMDDPEHARLRRMVTAPFMIKKMEAMRPGVQKLVDELIDDMLAGSQCSMVRSASSAKSVDLVQAFALPVPSLVICQLLGVPYADHDFFQENSKALINRDASSEERFAAGGRLFEYLDKLIGEKIENPRDDLLSGLVDRISNGELTRADAAQMGVLMLLAGHETTANMIALGTLALLEHRTTRRWWRPRSRSCCGT